MKKYILRIYALGNWLEQLRYYEFFEQDIQKANLTALRLLEKAEGFTLEEKIPT